MDNTDKFSGKAENYVKARPDYPEVLFDYLKSKLGAHKNSVFADIGAGLSGDSVDFVSAAQAFQA